ncbi:WD repeat domain-containing protein [Capsaspora owczarzaki ATCC 30864]|uniref:Probable cytosolic iron-sulfur protein assembly protein CIAO1 homolog n=1 Tax=Capsaspora owczarzaki (strain ATCC 30864) TaxID=595528 RepID=A0A0D2WPP0_CAPO3|nr:WD repeat domain-containing protein [Capsaspora owczarzaki ATCC 30864]KJE93430.1 WD repeat domain-containing protein [Capsaspora owczarzaki ATCC 30864]|eukprot:XP_004348048.1 WD repeat domain-containing protein [Capsaspora owczarzaki ATCC 30864]
MAAWNPAGTLLATVWQPELEGQGSEAWHCTAVLEEAHSRTVRAVAWSPDGRSIASGSFDFTVCIWDKSSGEFDCTATLEGHESEVKGVAFAPAGNVLASCSRDKSVWIWDVEEDGEFECAGVLHEHTQDVKFVRWHPTEPILASASYDNTIKLYREDDGDWVCYETLNGHESTVWALAFNADGSFMVSVSDDRSLKIWKRLNPGNKEGVAVLTSQAPKWKCVATVPALHERTILSVDWSPVTGLIATGGADNVIRILKFNESDVDQNGQAAVSVVCSVDAAHTQDVNSVAWNPVRGSLLASTSDDGSVHLWNISS